MAFNQEVVEQIGAWCLTSRELAPERAKAWKLFFGEDDLRPVEYWGGAEETVSRERRFLGWFMFDYALAGGEKPAEVAARRLYSGRDRAEALEALSGARYLLAVATRADPRGVHLELERESFEVRSPLWAANVKPGQAVVAYLVPVRQGYWLPGPGWFIWPVSIGPGMRAHLKRYQLVPTSTERLLQGRFDEEKGGPKTPPPQDDTLEAAAARMSAWARQKEQPALAMSAGQWQTLVQKHIARRDIQGFVDEVVGKLRHPLSNEDLQEMLALATNLWNNTPQPDRGGKSARQLFEAGRRSAHQVSEVHVRPRRLMPQGSQEKAPDRPRAQWHFDPDRGGKPVPDAVKRRTEQRIRSYAEQHFAGRYTRLDIRFRGQFCYVDAYREPEEPSPNWPPPDWPETREEMQERLCNTPVHLCRLRYFGDQERWSFAFYTYSNERYELSVFPSGEFFGPPEEAFRVSAKLYLR